MTRWGELPVPFTRSRFAELSVLAVVVAILLLSLGPWRHASARARNNPPASDASFNTLSVRTLRVVDAQGKPRFVIGAPLPNPLVQGKELPRSSPVTGIQFLDTDGNETGGLAIFDRVHGAGLCFDYDTGEAMCMTKAKGYKGIVVFDPPAKDARVGIPGSQRMELSLDDGKPRIALSDSKGRDRIVLAIDDHDNPTVQVLDANGKAVYEVPKP